MQAEPGRRWRYSPAEPVTEVRRVPIVENGEPLVPYLGVTERVVEARPRLVYTRAALLRKGVAERLWRAGEALPPGLALAVVEGWRPHHIQRRMYRTTWNRFRDRHPEWSDVQLRRVVNRFTAPIHDKVPPPHSTGGALDVLLARADGTELDHSSPYEQFDPRAYSPHAPGLSAEAQETRRVLFEALQEGGLTLYASEWWHWSYGDQGWAYRTDAPHAVYGRVEPDGWEPPGEDLVDAPLDRAPT